MRKKLQDGELTFQWALDFITELANHGLKHIVISPGSRSTPLTLAAAAESRIEKHVVLDERSAGFLALGIAKATGNPAALICTSGTAAANYFPAVIEAKMSGTPLLILTADRPPQLRAIGASQAIDQIKLYGDYPLMFFEVGEPQANQEDFDRLHLLAAQAYFTSKNENGPVHLNFAFRKPLEPSAEYLQSAIDSRNSDKESVKPPALAVHKERHNSFQFTDIIVNIISNAARPVIIAGPSATTQSYRCVVELSEYLSAPVIAESPSQLIPLIEKDHLVFGQDAFLRNREIREELKPDLIIRFGDQPIGKGLELYLKHHKDVYHILFSTNTDWQDATLSVNYRIPVNPEKIHLEAISLNPSPDWLSKWQQYRNRFAGFRNHLFKDGAKLTDGLIFHTIGQALSDSSNIFLSNSFPVRDLDLFAAPLRGNHAYFVNRGASGIDGIISNAIGATIASQKPGVLFIGDLAFSHDSNALLSNKFLYGKQTLVIVVINNHGGNIFRMLPVYQHKKYFETYFETYQEVSIPDLARAYHIGYRRVQFLSNLAASFKDLSSQSGIQILECITDADQSMAQREALWNIG